MTAIVVPPMEAEEVEKFKIACQAIGDSLNAEIKCEEVVSLRISWQNNRSDVAAVIGNLADYRTKKKSIRGPSITLGKPSEDYVESKNI
jgi:hypothetical protein